MRRLLIAPVLAVLACGAPLPPQHPVDGAASNPEDQVECHDERTTGTNMARSVCLSKDQADENRRAAQDWEKHPRNSPTGSKQ